MKDVQETLRKLKPIIGNKADQFWLAYLTEDRAGKAELETVLNLWADQLLGNNIDSNHTQLTSPPQEMASGEYSIGSVTYAGKTLFPFGIREDEWVQHTAIFGRSGAGKTNVVFKILQSFLEQRKPFLIFDWKRNYRDLLAMTDKDIFVYTVGRETSPLQFNPLIPPQGTDPRVWLKKLIEIIAHAYYVGEGVMFLFQEALHAVYEEFNVYSGSPQEYPTFNDVYEWLDNAEVRGRKALWMDSAMRTIKSICFGYMGNVVNTAKQPNIADLLERNVILELDSLTNADKTLIIESLLLWIHHHRLVEPDREQFKHAIIIEEAHHILLKKTSTGKEAITDTILREIRELGEAIVLVDQHPSLISIPALGNSYTTITLNLKHRSDVTAIASAMLLDEEERELIGRLPIGSAIVKLQGRWIDPFQITVPHIKVPKGSINDMMVSRKMAGKQKLGTAVSSTKLGSTEPKRKWRLSQMEQSFMIDIARNPYSGVVARYKRLGISRRKGDILKTDLIENELITPTSVLTRSGRMVLLDVTDAGWVHLEKQGIGKPPKRFNESLEHRYWKHQAAEYFKAQGYTVNIEEPVNGYTDIVIEKDGKRTAIEIETGNSDWKKNVEKNLKKDFDQILVLGTTPEVAAKMQGAAVDQGKQRVLIFPVQGIVR